MLDQIRYDNRSPDDVDTLPRGLAAYYTNNIVRWQHSHSARWADEMAPLLGALSAARDAKPATNLAAGPGLMFKTQERLCVAR